MEEYVKKNKHIERAIYKTKFPDSISMRDTWIKHTDDNWKDVLREKEADGFVKSAKYYLN